MLESESNKNETSKEKGKNFFKKIFEEGEKETPLTDSVKEGIENDIEKNGKENTGELGVGLGNIQDTESPNDLEVEEVIIEKGRGSDNEQKFYSADPSLRKEGESSDDFFKRVVAEGLDQAEEGETSKESKKDFIEIKTFEGKVHIVNLNLKNEKESIEDFMIRAKNEELGRWVPEEKSEMADNKLNENGSDTFFENPNHVDGENKEDLSPTVESYKIARLDLDMLLQYINHTFGERSDSYKSVFMAKSWLGKTLGHLDCVNPYLTKEPIKSASDIPPTADVFNNPKKIYNFILLSNLDKVLLLRKILGDIIEFIHSISLTEKETNAIKDQRLFFISLTNSYVNMCEARFELGYRLSKIKKG